MPLTEQGRKILEDGAARANVYACIEVERARQDAKWGQQNHDDYRWLAIATEELGEVAQAALEDEFGGDHAGTTREELIHLAAVVIQWLECIDRRAQECKPRGNEELLDQIRDTIDEARARFIDEFFDKNTDGKSRYDINEETTQKIAALLDVGP